MTEAGLVAPFLQVTGQDSELVGPAFSPDGTRLYFSSQTAISLTEGITYEVTGPFRHADSAPAETSPAPTTTALDAVGASDSGDGGDDNGLLFGGLIGAAVLAAGGAYLWLSRRDGDAPSSDDGDNEPST